MKKEKSECEKQNMARAGQARFSTVQSQLSNISWENIYTDMMENEWSGVDVNCLDSLISIQWLVRATMVQASKLRPVSSHQEMKNEEDGCLNSERTRNIKTSWIPWN